MDNFIYMFKKEILKILAVIILLLFSNSGISRANPAPPPNALRGTLNNWSVPCEYKADIDESIGFGATTIWYIYSKAYTDSVRAGGRDCLADAVLYADSKNVRLVFSMSMTMYGDGATAYAKRENFPYNTNAQNEFLSDLEFVVNRYPTLDGIDMEEIQSYNVTPSDGGLAWRTFNNTYLPKATAIVKKYHNIDSYNTFEWSFNAASNTNSGLLKIGIDTKFLNDNRVFNGLIIQNGGGVSAFQNNVANWKNRMPNLVVTSAAYLTSSGIIRDCGNPPGWNIPACWDQTVFQQVDWAHKNGEAAYIFVQMRMWRPASLWPADTFPGATAGDKIRYIWTGTGISSPAFSVPAGTYTVAKSVSLSTSTAGATIRYTTDGSTPTAASPIYTAPINISATTTIKAIAIKDSKTSPVASATYNMCVSPCTLNVTTVEITPSSATIIVGSSKTLTVTAKDQFGNSMAAVFGWASPDPSIATVDSTGKVTAVAVGGPIIITATSGGKTGSASITVITSPCGNHVKDVGESCDYSAAPTGCSTTSTCNLTCTACDPIPVCSADKGKTCTKPNICGQIASGTIECDGTCNAPIPALPAGFDDGISCTIDTCDKNGTVYHTNSCGGLIPCGRAGDDLSTPIDESKPCGVCAMFYLLKQIINFITGLSIAIGTFILIMAGLLYATSAGDPGKIALAKSVVTSVVIGLGIVFASWLIIAFILQVLGYGTMVTWNQVTCVL